MLVLAADNLQELFAHTGTSIDIPELGEMAVTADLDWTKRYGMSSLANPVPSSQISISVYSGFCP